MKRIAIVGNGNVANHLFYLLRNSNAVEAENFSSREIPDCLNLFDIILICVSDSAIEKVANCIFDTSGDIEGTVAHTAGSVSIDVLRPYFKNYGVLYPLQTFRKGFQIKDYRRIPVFIEGSDMLVETTLKELGKLLFDNVYPYDSNKREKLHLASVFACNFVNAMYSAAEEILRGEEIPFDVVRALISQTAYNALYHLPGDCQTGPAKRGDESVLTHHKELLNGYGQLAEIYEHVSEYIRKKHENDRFK